jgi:hypothetical protein
MNVRLSMLTFMGPHATRTRAAWRIGLPRQGTGVMAVPVANQERMLSIMH